MVHPVLQQLHAALADRYRFDRVLGRGSMATVFLAEDLRLGRRVAVKVLDPQLAALVGSDRFLREIRTTARLTHPNILPLHDSGESAGLLYYVMPYAEGETLRDRLQRVREGAEVLIRYTGLQTSKAGRLFKGFEVFVAGDETRQAPAQASLALVRREEG